MLIYKLKVLQIVNCVTIQWNKDVAMEYFPDNNSILTF